MSYFLFVDESGHDMKEAPNYVLAGVCIRDTDLWNLIRSLHDLEIRHFGRRYSQGNREFKGSKLLNTGTYRHLDRYATVQDHERAQLAKYALDCGAEAKEKHLKALALAKVAFVEDLFGLCASYRCRFFASIVPRGARNTESDGLRKDYGYLFERFFYFLEDQERDAQGVVVFDELDKAQSHILVDQMHKYFSDSATGRFRSSRIIPEPFFVHSELTTGIQIADIAAYCMSWGYRIPGKLEPTRKELEGFARQIAGLKHRTVRERDGNPDFQVDSITFIPDLRTRSEKMRE